MKTTYKIADMKFATKLNKVMIIICCSLLFSFKNTYVPPPYIDLPWKKAGLTERQAATHLLNRFTYGAKPGDIDLIIKVGFEKWIRQQLNASQQDTALIALLEQYPALKLSNAEVVNQYPIGGKLLKLAIKDGIINKDSVDKSDKGAYKEKLNSYMLEKGMKRPAELYRQLINQKILRATYSNNQLQEMLTDFWFNHFNVSLTKKDCALFIPSYERDVIRPNALGKFEDLLLATAKSPAMLLYLDNFSSAGTNNGLSMDANGRKKKMVAKFEGLQEPTSEQKVVRVLPGNKERGLNENYAREVMELHTLGVDGGYSQSDVTNAAKVLTGWTIYPLSENGPGNNIRKLIGKFSENKLTEYGFVHEGDFLFTPNRHDDSEKVVLGKVFPQGGGYEEGVELLKMLANHTSTANFISRKLAIRFVSDNPPQSLVNKMARTFKDKKGDIKEVLLTMVSSPEFWSKEAIREKTKSPFELAISTVRSLDADVTMPYQLFRWINKMGQDMYSYQAPTGFPDKGQYWINTGALLNRMNFGLSFAAQKIPGIKINLLALNEGHEPESTGEALKIYSRIMLPERDLTETIKRLTPLLNDPGLEKRIEVAATKSASKNMVTNPSSTIMMKQMDEDMQYDEVKLDKDITKLDGKKTLMTQVVGIIIGSPEFQRR